MIPDKPSNRECLAQAGPTPPTAGNLFNFNRYAYANDNPIGNIDPDGRYACGSSTSKSGCAKIDALVKTMNLALSKLQKGSASYNRLSAVSSHIGKLGDNNGVVIQTGDLRGGTIAQADSATLMTIDTKQIASFSSIFQKYNSSMNPGQLANAFGAEAIAHEGQHQLDYLNPDIGYPTNRASEHATEMNAYRTEIGVAKGLGVSNDLYAPGASQKDINVRINEGADQSTNAWCNSNACH